MPTKLSGLSLLSVALCIDSDKWNNPSRDENGRGYICNE